MWTGVKQAQEQWKVQTNNKMAEQTEMNVYEKLKIVWKYEEVLISYLLSNVLRNKNKIYLK